MQALVCVIVLVIAAWLVPYSLLVVKDLQAQRRDKGSSGNSNDASGEEREGERANGGGSGGERGAETECVVLTRSEDEQ